MWERGFVQQRLFSMHMLEMCMRSTLRPQVLVLQVVSVLLRNLVADRGYTASRTWQGYVYSSAANALDTQHVFLHLSFAHAHWPYALGRHAYKHTQTSRPRKGIIFSPSAPSIRGLSWFGVDVIAN